MTLPIDPAQRTTDIGLVGDPVNESEVVFWARQLSEHALFLHLGLEPVALRARAWQLHQDWERIRPSPSIPTFLEQAAALRAFKVEVLETLQKPRWLGWLFPTFVDHLRRELDLVVVRLTTGVSASKDMCAWLRFSAEHAAFAAHLMDPTEAARVAKAIALTREFLRLGQGCSAVGPQLLTLSQRAGHVLDKFVENEVPKARSTIHPVLGVHVLREGRRFLRVVDALRHQGVFAVAAPSAE